jgi:hypothetical protein
MLLNLPPEIINLITDILSPRSPKNPSRILQSCPHFAHDQNQDRLAIYDVSETPGGYETDVVRFTMAHPYIAKCIENCGRRIEVDATVVEGLGVVLYVPERFRQLVKYVFSFHLNAKGSEMLTCRTSLLERSTLLFPPKISFQRIFLVERQKRKAVPKHCKLACANSRQRSVSTWISTATISVTPTSNRFWVDMRLASCLRRSKIFVTRDHDISPNSSSNGIIHTSFTLPSLCRYHRWNGYTSVWRIFSQA